MTSESAKPPAPKRRRGRRWLIRLATLVALLGIAALVIDPFRGLPDVGEPPGVAEFRKVQVADEDNAFVSYRRAVSRLVLPGKMRDANDWASASAEHRRWLERNEEALRLFMEGSERNEARYIHPGSLRFDTLLPVTQNLPDLARLALIEASRRAEDDDPASAWPCYRAVLRASRHSGTKGGSFERLIGAALWNTATPEIERWAADPRLDSATLRRALADVEAAGVMTPPLSDHVKADYLMLTQTLEDPAFLGSVPTYLTDLGLSRSPPVLVIGGWPLGWDHLRLSGPSLRMKGEPERSKRVLRLLCTNWLASGDRPDAMRPERIGGTRLRLFLPRGDGPEASGGLSPGQIAREFEDSLIADMLPFEFLDPMLLEVPTNASFPNRLVQERENRGRLREVLGRQIRTREGGIDGD